MVNVQTMMQTDTITSVPCGTKDGILSEFERIEVVNFLKKESAHNVVKIYGIDYDRVWIHDKVHHEINQFCSNKTLREVYIDDFAVLDELLKQALQKDLDKHVNGAIIQAVRMTKPIIPTSIRQNYEAMEEQRTATLIAERTHELVERKIETERLQAVMAAKINAEESKIKSDMEAQRARIQAEVRFHEDKLVAEAKRYAIEEEAAANERLLTEAYLRLQETRVWEKNTKAYFGQNIPKLMVDVAHPVDTVVAPTEETL
ncbi:hypothetical protein CYMTET_53800 [Cymbomonas tetramitiformis]|uniref:Band 7 domain-containing protein n=1 Tax=Cymbomonas tetramitiformis TaxID=36881 RepID=A0AAE0EQ80_9CHLO|nr:hypothetical protein CYMTET_53800 [Cymbomonas tetramitiformis]